jgi:WD40 repeat protein
VPGVIEKHSSSSQSAASLTPLWSESLNESAISTAWSAKGNLLAAASASGSIYVFDIANEGRKWEWTGHQFGATQVAWHPQEALLASAGQDGKVRFWQIDAATALKTLDCGEEWVDHIAWSRSGRYLATAAGRKLKLWNSEGTLLRAYPDHPNTIAAIAWKEDSDELVSACYGQVQFWQTEEEKPHRAFQWKGSMLSLAWSADGRYLCHGNQDATVHFWIVKSGKELQMWGYPTKVRELAWDHRSRYLATGGGSAITVWDCSGKGPANTKPAVLRHHKVPVTKLVYQHEGSVLASGCGEGRLALWKPSKRKTPDATGFLGAPITDLAWSPDDGLLAVSAEDGNLAVYLCP